MQATAGLQDIGCSSCPVSGKVLLGVVAGNGQELPWTAFEVLHENSPGNSLTWAGRLADGPFQLVTVSGSSAEHRDYIGCPRALGGVVKTHGFGELGPGRAVHKRVAMPCLEITGSSGRRTPRGIASSFCVDMLAHSAVAV